MNKPTPEQLREFFSSDVFNMEQAFENNNYDLAIAEFYRRFDDENVFQPYNSTLILNETEYPVDALPNEYVQDSKQVIKKWENFLNEETGNQTGLVGKRIRVKNKINFPEIGDIEAGEEVLVTEEKNFSVSFTYKDDEEVYWAYKESFDL